MKVFLASANNNTFKSVKDISQAKKLVKYPVKLVFSDVDGTILNGNQMLPEAHLAAIKKLEAAKIPLIIATGRGYKALDPLFQKFQMHPETVITESGAVVVDKDKNKLFENKLSFESVEKILDAFKRLQAPDTYYRLTFDGDPYIEGSAQAFEKSTVKTYSVNSFYELLNRGILPTRALIAKFNSKSFKDIEELLSKFREILGGGFNIFNSGTKYAEITNNTVSKAGAIKFLQKYLKCDSQNIASIGDAENDICMSEYVSKNGGMSVAMGNCTEEMKEVSDFITDTVDEGGFLKFVNTILEINKSM